MVAKAVIFEQLSEHLTNITSGLQKERKKERKGEKRCVSLNYTKMEC